MPARAGPLVARDERSALAVGMLRAGSEAAQLDAARRLKERFAGDGGVLVGGQAAFYANGNDVAERDLLRTDLYAGAILALLAFWVFRSAAAALFVVLVGGFTVLVTSGALAALAHLTEVSAYARNVVSGLGLGLGVDYSLLLVSRLREEAVADGYGRPALERSLNTAGRTLTVSAAIVAGAGVSLLVFPQPLLRSIGLAVILVAVCAWLAARLPLTALLLLLGSRVNLGTPARWRDRLTPASRPDRHSWLYRHVRVDLAAEQRAGVLQRPVDPRVELIPDVPRVRLQRPVPEPQRARDRRANRAHRDRRDAVLRRVPREHLHDVRVQEQVRQPQHRLGQQPQRSIRPLLLGRALRIRRPPSDPRGICSAELRLIRRRGDRHSLIHVHLNAPFVIARPAGTGRAPQSLARASKNPARAARP